MLKSIKELAEQPVHESYPLVINQMTETWKRSIKHPKYLVSSQGRVISTKRKVPSLLTPNLLQKKGGYYSYTLDGRIILVHRLVIETFNGYVSTDSRMVVMHLNDNPSDNSIENLKVGTRSENARADRCIQLKRENTVFQTCGRTGIVVYMQHPTENITITFKSSSAAARFIVEENPEKNYATVVARIAAQSKANKFAYGYFWYR
jgi:hypothetical protein